MPIDDDTPHAIVDRVLEGIRPALLLDGGGVRVLSITTDTLTLKMLGSCRMCGSRKATFFYGIVPAIRASLPALSKIEADDLVWSAESG